MAALYDPTKPELYAALKMNRDATQKQLLAACERLKRKWINRKANRQLALRAWYVFRDPEVRAEYDAALAEIAEFDARIASKSFTGQRPTPRGRRRRRPGQRPAEAPVAEPQETVAVSSYWQTYLDNLPKSQWQRPWRTRAGRVVCCGAAVMLAIFVGVFYLSYASTGNPATTAQSSPKAAAAIAPVPPPERAVAAAAVAAGFTPASTDECRTDNRNQWIKLVDPSSTNWGPAEGRRGNAYGGKHPGSRMSYFSYDQQRNVVTAGSGSSLAGLTAIDDKGGKHYYRLDGTRISAPTRDPLYPKQKLVQLQFCGDS